MSDRPHVLLIVVDQMRRDALGLNRPGFAHTPHLDQLARDGVNFTRAYSSCPTCIPARAALFTGLSQERHGFTGYDSAPEWKYATTLPRTFTEAGYQTQCVGKMHVEPARATMGFENVVLHDGFLHDKRRKYRDPIQYDDYLPDVRRDLGPSFDIADTGIGCNGYSVRPWPWGERYHPTSWVTSQGVDFLKRRDPTRPFFLKVSYHRPHSPLDPPAPYLDLYAGRPMPAPRRGDWDDGIGWQYSNPENPIPREPHFVERARRAYCALVTQIDFEVNRLLIALGDLDLLKDTVVALVADHGDMLYDHGSVRKSLPFEESAGIPLFIRLPNRLREGKGCVTSARLAEIRDLFPTLCAACGIPVPEGLDGQDLLSDGFHREMLHGEHTNGPNSNQWLTDGHEKYCWFPMLDRELLFDLDEDPHETHDLSAERPDRAAFWRARMVETLDGRPEGYVKDGRLSTDCQPRSAQEWAGIGR